jgi:hypothetical protein
MTASDLCISRKKALACRGPSTYEAALFCRWFPDTGIYGGVPTLDRFALRKLEGDPNAVQKLRWLPPGARVSGTIRFSGEECHLAMLAGAKTASAAVTFILAAGKEVVILPLSADNVPVRAIGQGQ